jgi:hypothetical protein
MCINLLRRQVHCHPQLVSGFIERAFARKRLRQVGMRNGQPRSKPGDDTKVFYRAVHIALLKHQLSQRVLRVGVAGVKFNRLLKSGLSSDGITIFYRSLSALISSHGTGSGCLSLGQPHECAELQDEDDKRKSSVSGPSSDRECHSEDRLRVMLLSFNTVRSSWLSHFAAL